MLQWLRWAQVTGAARFRGAGEEIELFLERGRIVHARADGRSVRAGEALLRRGAVSPEALERALAAQRARGGRLGEHLPGLAPEALRDAIEECARRIVLRLLLWHEGSVRFVAERRWETRGVAADLDPEMLVLDALRIADAAAG